MVRALPRGEARRRLISSDTAERERSAALGYLLWPIAAIALAREDAATPAWSRLHARQALVLGVLLSIAYFVVLAAPLFVVLAMPGIALGTIVTLYLIGLIADVVGALVWFGIALAYARRARAGELFGVPLVTAIVDRLMRDAPKA